MENNVEYIFVPKRLRSRLQHGNIFKIAWNYHHFERTKLMQPLKLNEVTLIATNFIAQNNVNDWTVSFSFGIWLNLVARSYLYKVQFWERILWN